MKNGSHYTKLEVWTLSRKLANTIYEVTKNYPESEKFGLTNQLRRCAVSVPSNIAEGCGRHHDKETLHFLYISRGSLFELETQILISLDQNYINSTQNDSIQKKILSCKKLLNGFIKYLKQS